MRRVVAAALALALPSTALVTGALPAVADTGLTPRGQVTLVETVNGRSSATVAPGEDFLYQFSVGCSDVDCVGARLTDVLPAELAGFAVAVDRVSPAVATATLVGCDGGVVAAGCTLDATFEQALEDAGAGPAIGIPAGQAVNVWLRVSVPAGLDPTWPLNGTAIGNPATATADNSTDQVGTATVTVSIPYSVDVAVTKQWAASTVQYAPGGQTSFTVGVGNASNAPAESLVLQDPQVADDGATGLPASNPFRLLDVVGFCSPSTLPAGADRVQVDAYVESGGVWSWVTGTPATAPALPAGVSAAEVAGLRLTYTSTLGAQLAAGGAAAAQCVTVAQRATDRETGDPVPNGAAVANRAAGTVTVPTQDPATKTADATLTVAALTVAVTAGKTIEPAGVPASGTFTVNVSARNDSNGTLDSLTIDEPGAGAFLSDTLVFDGFVSGQWPEGADSGELVWTLSGGGTETVEIGPGDLPAAPSLLPGEHVTGFTTTWTGDVEPDAAAGWVFRVRAADDAVPVTATPPYLDFTNTVAVSGSNGAGTAQDTADAGVRVYYPTVGVALEKSLQPSVATPGGTVVATLTGTTTTGMSAVRPTQIVVEDVWDGSTTSFWDAFRARGVLFTDVPAGAALKVEYATGTPAAPVWSTLVDGRTEMYSADLPSSDDVIGVRFTFTDAAGFAQDVVVRPNVVFEASGTLRTGGATAAPDGVPVPYDNHATANAQGQAGGVTVFAPEATADDEASVVDYGDGPGTVLASKRWALPGDLSTGLSTLGSQSGSAAATVVGWGVTVPGYASVRVSDARPGDEATPAATVFQAFDLTAIEPVGYAQDPLLRWDEVTDVELFLWDGAGGGTWTSVSPNDGSGEWMRRTGAAAGFKGYTLTAEQSAAVTGVRITVAPDDGARAAEASAASPDPTRPAVGTGVAWSATERTFALDWRLRNRVRDEATARWATAGTTFDTADPGAVRNDAEIAATTAGSDPETYTRDVAATVTLVNSPPGVDVAKSASSGTVVAPYPGALDPADYPTLDFTVSARNTATARASYLRVTDPGCGGPECVTAADDWGADVFSGRDYDPSSNPFEVFTLTGVDFTVPAGASVDADASRAVLWHRADGGTAETVESLTMAELDALGPDDLRDVVGVAVVYQSADPDQTGGLLPRDVPIVMTLHTQLRAAFRSAPDTPVTGHVAVANDALVQSFDPVLTPSGTASRPNASDDAQVLVTDARLDVVAGKAFSADWITEPEADQPVHVTLTAGDGDATLAPETVTLTDDDAGFWDSFELTGLGTVTRPAGADLVRVDVLLDGGASWVLGAPAATAALPSAVTDPARVTGVRLVFFDDPSRPFSSTLPSAGWTATAVLDVRLRDGVAFPGSVSDTVVATAAHADRDTVTDDATDTIALTLGTPRISVEKEAPAGHVVEPGQELPWTLTFTNVGESYLGITELDDYLGDYLRYGGSQPTFASTGELPTTGITVTQPEGGESIVFGFPAGARMAPGDTFTVTVGIILLPGLVSGQRATNEFRVVVDRDLAPGDCVNVSGNGRGLLGDLAADECGTSNYVVPVEGALLFTEKEVRADVDGDLVSGAVNVTNPALPCSPQSGGWYRTVCTPYTVIGGVDEWRIGASNTGTVPITDLTYVDVLPHPGDVLLSTGGARGSDFQPVLAGARGMVPNVYPDGLWDTATYEPQVTTAPAACVGGSGTAWNADPTCAAVTWEAWDTYDGDWADVTAVRIVVHFAATRPLLPGELVSFVYATVNTPAGGGSSAAGAVVPAVSDTTLFAWNQMGGYAEMTSGETRQRTPARTGVRLATGALEVRKAVTGDASASAPDEVAMDVACTVAGAPVDLGASATLTVPTGGSARIDGIPLGSECTVAEHGDLGEYGEAARTPDGSQQVAIDTQVAAGDPVPTAQVVTVTNRYDPPPPSIDVTASAVCVADVPWLEYSIVPHGVDMSTHEATFTWYADADQDGVPDGPALGSRVVPAGGDLTGALLWPGAAVDADGVGVAWPGWRVARVGETPDWENYVEDPTLPEWGLRAGAMVLVQVNPTDAVTSLYPPTTPGCAVARTPDLTLTKEASRTTAAVGDAVDYRLTVADAGYGATDDVVLTDPVPAGLRVDSVEAADPADDTIAPWTCDVTDRAADGTGGTVRCVLGGWLGHGQTAPVVTVRATVVVAEPGDAVVNTATVAWADPDEPGAPGRTASSSAPVAVVLGASLSGASVGGASSGGTTNPAALAWTGVEAVVLTSEAVVGFALVVAGLVLVVLRRRRS